LGAESSSLWASAAQNLVSKIGGSDAIAFGAVLGAIVLVLASTGLLSQLTILQVEASNSVIPNLPIVRSIPLNNFSTPFLFLIWFT
jgi:hypothetical protein